MFKALSNKLFPLQITKKIYVWMILLIIIPTTLLSIIIYLKFISLEKNRVHHILNKAVIKFSNRLESTLDTYPKMLINNSTRDQDINQQIKKLNNEIQPLVNRFLQENPNYGIGVYSNSMNRVVAYGPNFNPKELYKFQKHLANLESHKIFKPQYEYTNLSLNWKKSYILKISYPIFYNNEIVGYLVGSIMLKNIYIGALLRASGIIGLGLLLSAIFIILSWKIFSRFKKELEEFSHAVALRDNKGMQKGILPELNELLRSITDSEKKYRTIFENTGTAIIIIEEDTSISLVNVEFEKLTGYSKTEIENSMSWKDFINDKYLRELNYYYKSLNANKCLQPQGKEIKLVTKDGNIKEVSVNISLIPGTKTCVASLLDITKLKYSEQELIVSMDRFYKTFHSTPSAMTISRLSDDKIIEINNGFSIITGYNFEEVYNDIKNQINLWKDHEEYSLMIERVKKKGYVKNLEMTFRTKHGEDRNGLLSAEKIELDGDECMIILMMDITERNQLKKEMQQLDRLNLVGEMAAGIGHEIRNPMTTVRGFLQLLSNKKEYINDKAFFDLMIEELDRANAIIKEYLTLAKNKAVDLVPININNILKTLFPLIQADALLSDKHIKLELQTIEDLFLDEKEIRQLILNLTRNGLEAMNNSGLLTIRTFMENNHVVLSVQDQGHGIPADIIDKIGTPFFTTKEYGTGLGLAVCYSIAARHNANIELDTNEFGTTFFVHFEGETINSM